MVKSETIYPYTSKKKDIKEHVSKPMTEKLIRFSFELSFLYEIKNCNVAKINDNQREKFPKADNIII